MACDLQQTGVEVGDRHAASLSKAWQGSCAQAIGDSLNEAAAQAGAAVSQQQQSINRAERGGSWLWSLAFSSFWLLKSSGPSCCALACMCACAAGNTACRSTGLLPLPFQQELWPFLVGARLAAYMFIPARPYWTLL